MQHPLYFSVLVCLLLLWYLRYLYWIKRGIIYFEYIHPDFKQRISPELLKLYQR